MTIPTPAETLYRHGLQLVETDSPFDMTYIAVVTVKAGLITSYRDYWNPLAVSLPGTDFAGATR